MQPVHGRTKTIGNIRYEQSHFLKPSRFLKPVNSKNQPLNLWPFLHLGKETDDYDDDDDDPR